jgi:hypothetical protein
MREGVTLDEKIGPLSLGLLFVSLAGLMEFRVRDEIDVFEVEVHPQLRRVISAVDALRVNAECLALSTGSE